MAIDAARLQTLRDSMVEAAASGVLELVDQNGEKIRYRSVQEINRAIARLDREIAELGGDRSRTLRVKTSKGL